MLTYGTMASRSARRLYLRGITVKRRICLESRPPVHLHFRPWKENPVRGYRGPVVLQRHPLTTALWCWDAIEHKRKPQEARKGSGRPRMSTLRIPRPGWRLSQLWPGCFWTKYRRFQKPGLLLAPPNLGRRVKCRIAKMNAIRLYGLFR